ncbi:MAG: DNA-binding response regulator [Bacteroidetes bacterium]|nr:MAG: DNA-binding response regulator [Bacteroidota bacterium]REK06490.1 MAG: DNA-binding response regulator [Bacteroidota bacterium]REK33256.1 MAG: DNA-binding response regulator [Bacteroidota bacterium]REK47093.1 MAG: DNA-binding response regulator [Bacteroidota bacterium]
MNILIADDHSIVRRGLVQILKEEFPDAYCSEVSDGFELLRNIHERNWDIIITDISMPGKNGIDAIKDLKAQSSLSPILVLSIYPENQYAMRVLKSGASGYITKDSAPAELIKAVRTILKGKKYISHEMAQYLLEAVSSGTTEYPHDALSDREFLVLKMIASGKSLSDIADELSISINTVSTYKSRILGKLKMSSNAELTQYALSNNLIP